MQKFLLRRFIYSILTLIAATAIVFGLSRASGDPILLFAKPGGYGMSPENIAAIEARLGLDRPLVVQYFMWLGNALRGDLGRSIFDEQPVTRVIGQRIGATFELGIVAWIFATAVGVPLGVLSAVKRGTVWDYLGRIFALTGQATPVFVFGIVSILIFSVWLGWFPAGQRGSGWSIPHLTLPVISLGLGAAAAYLRITRSAMLEVLDSEYVKLARAKGVSNTKLIWKHALRNALIPPLTVSSLVMVGFITGTVLVETVFTWPGLGRLTVEAVWNNDFPLMTGAVLIFAAFYVTMNFLSDVAYALIDPRIQYD